MVLLLSNSTSIHVLSQPLFSNSNHHHHCFRPKIRLRNRRNNLSVCSIEKNSSLYANNQNREENQPRTLFLGGYKRPEIAVPNIVLQLSPEEVLDDRSVLKVIDEAVLRRVGIVVLNGGAGSGGRLYEAACLLKSVIRDRAYLMIAERVDIAAAVNASGVVLSDQGLPAIVARNTMIGSRSDSVVLPLVARKVQSSDAALSACSSEGADFLIYGINGETYAEEPVLSILRNVTVPIFFMTASLGFDPSSSKVQDLLKSGASGLVVSLKELKGLSDNVLDQLSNSGRPSNKGGQGKFLTSEKLKALDFNNDFPENSGLKRKERLVIKTEKSVLLEVIEVVQEAAPLMEEVSLLIDAVAQLDEPFLLAIVGEFNSGKSTVINALLGNKYLKDGVVPTTNEIMFLRYSELESDGQQRCERHPDGQYICYLPAPILKEMIIVDTPGTNVILQRQQRLTEEFVPRADLVLFVISADRPLTESEVAFLRYTQQWKKKVVFVLNKSDIYQNANELEEAMAFIKDNSRKLLNVEDVTLYPVSARSALEAKLSASYYTEKQNEELSITSQWKVSSFQELEKFLYSFLDGSTSTGFERMKLKLETPLQISLQLLSASQKSVREKAQQAKQDVVLANKLVDSVKEYTTKMENESISRRRQILSLIDQTQARIIKVIDSTLQLSNLDLVASYAFKEKSTLPATLRVRDDIIGTALSDAKKQLGEYVTWLKSSNVRERRMYNESFEKRWPSVIDFPKKDHIDAGELQIRKHELSLQVIENFSAAAASVVLEKEIRLAFLGTFGGLGAAGLSASLLTSVLPTTIEDLLALALCSAGGWFAISNFPARRQKAIEKVKKTVNALALKLEEAMEKDLLEATQDLENFVKLRGKPYQDQAQLTLDKLLEKQDKLTNVEKKVETLQIEIQNLHVSDE